MASKLRRRAQGTSIRSTGTALPPTRNADSRLGNATSCDGSSGTVDCDGAYGAKGRRERGTGQEDSPTGRQDLCRGAADPSSATASGGQWDRDLRVGVSHSAACVSRYSGRERVASASGRSARGQVQCGRRRGPCAWHRQGAGLFFQLISRRYERGAMMLTSNQSFGSWGDVFGDRVIRLGHPRPRAAPLHHGQHQGRQLPAAREAQGRPAQIEDGLGGDYRPRLNTNRRGGGEISMTTPGDYWMTVDKQHPAHRHWRPHNSVQAAVGPAASTLRGHCEHPVDLLEQWCAPASACG